MHRAIVRPSRDNTKEEDGENGGVGFSNTNEISVHPGTAAKRHFAQRYGNLMRGSDSEQEPIV